MKNKKMLGLFFLLGIVGVFVSAGYATDCVDGCYTQWTAQISNGRCRIYDPYNCVDGASYRFPQDDIGECEPDPGQTFDHYDCPTSYCDAICTNCAAGQLCLYYQFAPIDGSCNWNGNHSRKKCSEES